MPLNRRIVFKTKLQRQNRIQIPKLVRWQYKLELSEILKVTVNVCGLWSARETFLARMDSGGRIRIPNLTDAFLRHNHPDKPSLEGHAIEVALEPP